MSYFSIKKIQKDRLLSS